MNIAVLHRYPVSQIKGTNPSFLYFLRELSLAGHQPYVVTLKEDAASGYPADLLYFPLNLTFKRANDLDKWIKSLLFALAVPFKVRSLKARFNLEMVYCDDSLPFYAYLVKIISGLPCVMRMGDLQTAYMCFGRGSLGRMLYKILHALEKFTWKKIDKIIAISESFKRFLIEEGVASTKIAMVRESIDIEEFGRSSVSVDIRKKFGLGREPLVMFHGLVSKIKGLDILLKAFPVVLEKFPAAKLIIVGGGEQLAGLKRLAEKLGITGSVIFTGWVAFSDIPCFILACDAGIPLRSANPGNNFVVTTAFLQYSVLRLPVAVPGLEAFKDILADNPLQEVFSLRGSKELSACVIKLLEDRQTAQASAENNYKMAADKFSARKIARDLAKEAIL